MQGFQYQIFSKHLKCLVLLPLLLTKSVSGSTKPLPSNYHQHVQNNKMSRRPPTHSSQLQIRRQLSSTSCTLREAFSKLYPFHLSYKNEIDMNIDVSTYKLRRSTIWYDWKGREVPHSKVVGWGLFLSCTRGVYPALDQFWGGKLVERGRRLWRGCGFGGSWRFRNEYSAWPRSPCLDWEQGRRLTGIGNDDLLQEPSLILHTILTWRVSEDQ